MSRAFWNLRVQLPVPTQQPRLRIQEVDMSLCTALT